MSVPVKIQDGNGTGTEAHVHFFDTANGKHAGVVALTHPFIETEPSTKFFLNDTVGGAMNQNVTFGGSKELIFDGGSGGTEGGDSGDGGDGQCIVTTF